MHRRPVLILALVLALACVPAADARAEEGPYAQDQLQELIAPLALYPDAVLASLLPATTHPLEVLAAARYVARFPEGTTPTTPPLSVGWDASVVTLVQTPDLLTWLADDVVWLEQLGAAMTLQPDEVLLAVQVYRWQAYAAGELRSNEHVAVRIVDPPAEVMQAGGGVGGTHLPEKLIVIESVRPEVLYVPVYDPATVVRRGSGARLVWRPAYRFGHAGFWSWYELRWPWWRYRHAGGFYRHNQVRYWGRPRPASWNVIRPYWWRPPTRHVGWRAPTYRSAHSSRRSTQHVYGTRTSPWPVTRVTPPVVRPHTTLPPAVRPLPTRTPRPAPTRVRAPTRPRPVVSGHRTFGTTPELHRGRTSTKRRPQAPAYRPPAVRKPAPVAPPAWRRTQPAPSQPNPHRQRHQPRPQPVRAPTLGTTGVHRGHAQAEAKRGRRSLQQPPPHKKKAHQAPPKKKHR